MAMPRKNDPDMDRGLYPKFTVSRLDPDANERHAGCEYFVLDLNHDRFAVEALESYARDAEKHGYAKLAHELRDKAARARKQWCQGNDTGFHTCGLPVGGCTGANNG